MRHLIPDLMEGKIIIRFYVEDSDDRKLNEIGELMVKQAFM